MSRCLRCGAGSEWIEGKVPDQPKATSEQHEILRRSLERGLKLMQQEAPTMVDIFQHCLDELARLEHP